MIFHSYVTNSERVPQNPLVHHGFPREQNCHRPSGSVQDDHAAIRDVRSLWGRLTVARSGRDICHPWQPMVDLGQVQVILVPQNWPTLGFEHVLLAKTGIEANHSFLGICKIWTGDIWFKQAVWCGMRIVAQGVVNDGEKSHVMRTKKDTVLVHKFNLPYGFVWNWVQW